MLLVLGRAGTGKSTLLRELCNNTRKNYVVLAPTGIAAVNVQGETIHSFFKFKPGILYHEAERLGERYRNGLYDKLQLVVIDEISMVRADLLDCVDVFLRKARNNDSPFGGVQMVFFGDLYQLEPVVKGDERDVLFSKYNSAYFFSSHVFQLLMQDFIYKRIHYLELTTVYRQKDEKFIELLDRIRTKRVTDEDLYNLNRQYQEYVDDTMQEYIYITGTNREAEVINDKNLEAVPNEEYTFLGNIEGNFNEKSLPTDDFLKLKQHARVMLLNNDVDHRWINGTLGWITDIKGEDIYVKLDNGTEHIIPKHTWSNYKYSYDLRTGKVKKEEVGSFTQYPLKLAWALTVHKSQGQTFDKVVIWFEGRAFAHGQMYVALSRCRTLEGIILRRPIQHFDIMADEKVNRFFLEMDEYNLRYS
jgi:ATP-dependent exoDNAse (exonuclease V) alpha subunit